jgi:O-antigen/teichoic acid export membrane protein
MPDLAGDRQGPPPRPAGRRTFLLNALSSYGQRALVGLSALVLTPILFRTLGTDGFGTWSVMFTLTTIFSMIEVGFSLGTTKFIAQHRAENRRREMEATLGASVVLMLGLGLVALAVSVAIALFASGLAAADDEDAFRAGMIILGGAYFLRLPFVAYGSALAGYQRYDLYNLGQAVTVIVSTLGAIAVVAAGGGVLGVAIAYAVAFVAGGIGYALLLRRLDSRLRLVPRSTDRSARRRVLGFSSFTLLADSMMFAGARLDTVVIAALRNAAAAAPFAAANKLQTGIQTLTLPVINLMLPMVSDLEARGMREAVIERLLLATRVTLQVTAPVALAFAFFSADIVDLWLGDTAPAVTASIVTILVISTWTLCAVPANRVLIGIGRARTVGWLNAVEGLLNLAISIALVSAYGAIGAAIGTLISSSLIGPAHFPVVCRATEYPLSRFLRVGLWPAVVSSLPSAAAMLLVWLLMAPSSGRLLVGLLVGVSAAALVAALQLGPRRALRELRTGLGGPRAEPEAAPEELLAEGPS